jgi:hypothetical protein
MKLELIRTYLPRGTNGVLSFNKIKICATIELPYKNNAHRISCVPEGEYELVKRWSPKFKDHLWLKKVPGRELILIHPANDAIEELKGCIAPVSFITGQGKGALSKPALKKLLAVIDANAPKDKIILVISKA